MSDTPVLPLPPSYDWGLVVGRSISAMADTIADPDRFPEARGSNGRVTFTPHTRYKKELSAPTAFVQFEVITAKIVNGKVVDAQGEDGIYLISGAYKVAFTIDSGSIPGFDILVTPDHTLENPLDLVTAAPYVPEVGTPVTTAIIPAGAAEDQVIAWRNGRLVWVNGSVQAEAAADRAEAAATAAEEWKPEFTWSDTNLVIDGVPGPDLTGPQGDNGDITAGRMLKDENLDTFTRTEFLTQISAPAATLELNYPVKGRAVHIQVIGSDDRYVAQIAIPLISSTALPWHWRTKFGSEWRPWQTVPASTHTHEITDVDGLQTTIDQLTVGTGWRVVDWLPEGHTVNGSNVLRQGSQVTLIIDVTLSSEGGVSRAASIPVGFRPTTASFGGGQSALLTSAASNTAAALLYINASGSVYLRDVVDGERARQSITWQTDNAWPATLPGDPI